MDPTELNWPQLNSTRPNRTRLNPTEPDWTQLNPYEPNRTKLNPTEPDWTWLEPTYADWTWPKVSEHSWTRLSLHSKMFTKSYILPWVINYLVVNNHLVQTLYLVSGMQKCKAVMTPSLWVFEELVILLGGANFVDLWNALLPKRFQSSYYALQSHPSRQMQFPSSTCVLACPQKEKRGQNLWSRRKYQ